MAKHARFRAKPESEAILKSVGHELKTNPPRSLKRQHRKKGKKAAEKMRRVILLSKSRAMGARA